MKNQIKRVELALDDLRKGKMILLTDDPGRENEGDLVVAAEHVTIETMNFMMRHGSGIVCLAITNDYAKKFNLPLMIPSHENSSMSGTPFTITIDAKHGATTGVSSADRVQTILTMVNDHATEHDFVKPGHIFPLLARENGVFE